jgi:hypothetical protein
MLSEIERGGIDAIRRYARELDGYAPERFRVAADVVAAAAGDALDPGLRDHLELSKERVSAFAELQLASVTDVEREIVPGLASLSKRGAPVVALMVVLLVVLGGMIGQQLTHVLVVNGIYLVLGLAVVLITPGIAGRVRTGLLSKDGDPLVDSA